MKNKDNDNRIIAFPKGTEQVPESRPAYAGAELIKTGLGEGLCLINVSPLAGTERVREIDDPAQLKLNLEI